MRVRAEGTATRAYMLVLLRKLQRHSDWKSGMDLLLDYRELDLTRLSFDHVFDQARMVDGTSAAEDFGKIAHVVSRDLEFGIIRSWEMLAGPEVASRTRCFRAMDDAEAWLAQSKGCVGPYGP